jgi:hypothetical protein
LTFRNSTVTKVTAVKIGKVGLKAKTPCGLEDEESDAREDIRTIAKMVVLSFAPVYRESR